MACGTLKLYGHGHRYVFTRDELNSCLSKRMYPSRETMSRTNLQLTALHREIDRCEVKMSRNRMANVMRRPHFRLPIVLIRLNCASSYAEVCHNTIVDMHNVFEVRSSHRES